VKHVPKSPEPPALTAFRAAQADATWEALRNDPLHGGQQAYVDIKRTVVRDQRGLCAYCECGIARGLSDDELEADRVRQVVEHFHPKSDCGGPLNWALLWTNLWGVCDGGSQVPPTGEPINPDRYLPPLPANLSCDQFKDHQVSRGELDASPEGWILSPSIVPSAPNLFRFDLNGGIHPHDEACAEWQPAVNRHAGTQQLVEATIRHLNLDCFRLKRRRGIVRNQLEKAIQKLRSSQPGERPQQILQRLARRLFRREGDAQIWPEYFSLVRERLGEAAEAQLRQIGFRD
jgi:uncharacterized protein (TIGR02646 family)